MKVLIFTLAILLVATCVPCQAGMKKYMEECKTEAGITEDMRGKKPNLEDPKVKCFITCLNKKIEIVGQDGKVNEENLIKKMSKKQELDEAKKNEVKACATAANAVEGCEVGVTLKKCLMEKGLFKKPEGKENKENKGSDGEAQE